jgi:hypothetical protein
VVLATRSGPAERHTDLLAGALHDLAAEASRRGCLAVHGVVQSTAVDAGVIYVSLLGTGARPIIDPHR